MREFGKKILVLLNIQTGSYLCAIAGDETSWLGLALGGLGAYFLHVWFDEHKVPFLQEK